MIAIPDGARRLRLAAAAAALGIQLVVGSLALPQEQQPTTTPQATSTAANSAAALPDVAKLMEEVEAHQKLAESVEKDYIYHSVETAQEMDGHGGLKKTEVEEYDVFWMQGGPVRRLLKKDGKDLSSDELKKEDQRLEKEAARERERREKADAKGKDTDPSGHDEVTVSRFLELGRFENERCIQWKGRDTIVVDYAGDPKAKTRNSFENVIRDLLGTIWIDEQDRTIVKLEGHFVNDFKLGGGLLVNIHKGMNFSVEQVRINDEVWLPSRVEANGSARILLFKSVNGRATAVDSNYRKFKTSSTIVAAGGAAVKDSTVTDKQSGTTDGDKPEEPK